MSRQHSNLFRGTSHDERVKTRTKKHRPVDQEHRQETNPSRAAEGEGRNTESMSALARRNSEVRFKASDLKLLDLTVKELTLLQQLDEYERQQNHPKARELREHLKHVRGKKAEVANSTEAINCLLRSGSPRGGNGVIACEMSPTSHYPHLGLIERKIEEENRERTTFEAIRKKELCFARIFEHVDRIADKLNVTKGEKIALSFKNFVARIEASVAVIVSREVQLKNALKQATDGEAEIARLKEQNEKLAQQNLTLRGEISTLTDKLEDAMTAHRGEMAQTLQRCVELQQDFELIVKEKLDAETSLSHEGRRHREAVKGLERKARRIREFAREAKYLHSQLRQSAKEHRNNLECYSRETFNEVICAYTQELFNNANRHKRELAQAEAEQEKNAEAEREVRERALAEANRAEAERRRNQLAIVRVHGHYIVGKQQRLLSFWQGESIACFGKELREMSSQTQYERPRQLAPNSINSNIFQVSLAPTIPTIRQLHFWKEAVAFTYTRMRQRSQGEVQTDEYEQQRTVQHSQTQTIHQKTSSSEIQATTDQIHASTQSIPVSLSIYHQANNTIFPLITPTTDTATSPISHDPTLALTLVFSETVTHRKQTTEEGTNTEEYASIYRSGGKQEMYFESSQKKQARCEDSILQLLLQAEECTMVPEICLLREEIAIYRTEIDRLNKTVLSLQSEREQEPVFQFCY